MSPPHIVKKNPTLRDTLTRTQKANRDMQLLRRRGLLDPDSCVFDMTMAKLAPQFRFLDEKHVDFLVDQAVSIPDERTRALAVGATAPGWSAMTRGQQEKILSAIEIISDPVNQDNALGPLGKHAVTDMTKAQQDRWARAVANIDDEITRCWIIEDTKVDDLNSSALKILRDSIP